MKSSDVSSELAPTVLSSMYETSRYIHQAFPNCETKCIGKERHTYLTGLERKCHPQPVVALMSMLHDLYDEFIDTGSSKYLVVEGDAKLYELLQSLKREYNYKLAWLIPYHL